MKSTILLLLALSLAAAQTPSAEAFTWGATSYASIRDAQARELGGVDDHGRFYLVLMEKKSGREYRRYCSRRVLIAAVEKSTLERSVKTEALRLLGKITNVQVFVLREPKQ